jgi:adenosylhomocysteine nucleosidase
VTGVGRDNASHQFGAALGAWRPGLVMTCGYAGGLDPELEVGTVCFDPPEAAGLRDRLLQAGALPASFHCADRISTTAAEKASIRQATGAQAVEMESGEIHRICRLENIPCVTLRAISDAAGEDLPVDFNRLMNRSHAVDMVKLVGHILLHPGCVVGLLRLHRATREAGSELARVLSAVVPGS